jgi:excisionase family DNA binding protein
MQAEPWSTLQEVAKHLQVSEETVHRWMEKRALPAHRAGRVWRFKLSEVDHWIRSGGAADRDEGPRA